MKLPAKKTTHVLSPPSYLPFTIHDIFNSAYTPTINKKGYWKGHMTYSLHFYPVSLFWDTWDVFPNLTGLVLCASFLLRSHWLFAYNTSHHWLYYGYFPHTHPGLTPSPLQVLLIPPITGASRNLIHPSDYLISILCSCSGPRPYFSPVCIIPLAGWEAFLHSATISTSKACNKKINSSI